MQFCPKCFLDRKLGCIQADGEGEYFCEACKEKYPQHTTFVSESAVRVYVKEKYGKADHLLEQLEEIGE